MISAEEFLSAHASDDGHGAPTAPRRDRKATGPSRTRGTARALPGARAGSFSHATADDPMDAEACKEAALRLLDAADRPTGALRARLLERGYDAQVADAVVARLVELRLVDDVSYAQSAIRSCTARMYGRRGTLQELVRKGVDRSLAEREVRMADEEGVFVDAAWQLGRSVAKRTRGKDASVRRRRFWGAAARKGHESDVMRQVADALFSDHEDDGEG